MIKQIRVSVALYQILPAIPHSSVPFLIKARCEVLPFLSFDTSLCIFETRARGTTHGKEVQIFVFRELLGTLMGKFLRCKRQSPDPAHLRVLWWNNSKCLSCIVWHAAGGALKPLLPTPKAPLNKIVKNNSFTLIFPSDYCSQGGKLAAGPCAFLSLWRCYIFICKRLLLSLPCMSSLYISLSCLHFLFPVCLSLISLCGRKVNFL